MKIKTLIFLTLVLATTVLNICGHTKDKIPREDTVIFDIDSGAIANPFNFNPMVPGTYRNQGMHQAVWEPLFILNYESNDIEP